MSVLLECKIAAFLKGRVLISIKICRLCYSIPVSRKRTVKLAQMCIWQIQKEVL